MMNRESFHENLIIRLINGIIVVDLISHWFVIFFGSEEACSEFLPENINNKQKHQFELMETFVKVMSTEGTIFITEWMLILYGSFQLRPAETEFSEKEKK